MTGKSNELTIGSQEVLYSKDEQTHNKWMQYTESFLSLAYCTHNYQIDEIEEVMNMVLRPVLLGLST